MEKNNYENVNEEKKTPKVAIYIRVGCVEQLSDEARYKPFNTELEDFRKKYMI